MSVSGQVLVIVGTNGGILEVGTPEKVSAAVLERMMKQDVILKAVAKKISWMEAAEIPA
jgi:hypothetical protein